MATAERALWRVLRGKALGPRVRSQHVIRGWIVDFYCFAAGLVIEVDGDVHDLKQADDERRTDALRLEGLEVLRVRNEEVFADIAGVVARIVEAMHRPRIAPDRIRREVTADESPTRSITSAHPGESPA